MLTFLRSALSVVTALIICSCTSFAQQVSLGVIPAGIPDTGKQLDVIVEGRVKIDNTGSSGVNLRATDNANAGIVSLTTLQAPQDALRHYDNAQEAFAKTKLNVAELELKRATDIYPRFAIAWTLLGSVHEKQARLDQAKADYLQAMSADSRLVSKPFLNLKKANGVARATIRSPEFTPPIREPSCRRPIV